MISYLIDVSLCWFLFYGFYFLLLQNQTFFGLNRFYLLGSFLLSLVLPLVEVEALSAQLGTPIAANYLEPITITAMQLEYSMQEIVVTPEGGTAWNLSDGLWMLYVAGVFVAGLRFLIGIGSLCYLRYSGRLIRRQRYLEVQHQTIRQPFSFLRWMFWNTSFDFTPAEEKVIRNHEEAHIRQFHSLDILLLELVYVFVWFHPMVYWYKKSLQSIHEYEADKAALKTSSYSKYGQILLQQIRGSRVPAFTHPFFKSMLKNRILMMKKNPSTRSQLFRYLPAIPMAVLMFLVFSNKNIQTKIEQPMQASLEWVKLELMSFDEAFIRNALQQKLTSDVDAVETETGEPVSSYFERTLRITHFQQTYRRLVKTFPGHKAQIDAIAKEVASEFGFSIKMKGDTMVYKDLQNNEMSEGAKRYVERRRMLESRDDHSREVSTFLQQLEIEDAVKDTIPDTFTEKAEVEEIALMPDCNEGTYEERKACSAKALLTSVYSHVRYPEEARKAGEQGMVVVKIHISEKGAVKGAEVVKSVSPSLDNEALRAVSWIPNLLPAKKEGKAVPSVLHLPIKFKLDKEVNASSEEEKKKQTPVLPLKDQKETIKDLSPDEVFIVVEEMPMFNGCDQTSKGSEKEFRACNQVKLLEYIYSNIKYPKEAREKGISGVVVVRFVVDKVGEIRDVEIVRSLGGGTDEEVLRVVESMPDWIPGKQRGVPVNVEFKLPIKFKIDPNIPIQKKENEAVTHQVEVYPNPARDQITLEFELQKTTPATLQLFDLKGQLILKKEMGSIDKGLVRYPITLPETLVPGNYSITLTLGDQVISRPVIIQPKK